MGLEPSVNHLSSNTPNRQVDSLFSNTLAESNRLILQHSNVLQVPGRIGRPTTSNVTWNSFTLHWTAPDAMGSPITSFTIQSRTSAHAGWEGATEKRISWKEARLHKEKEEAEAQAHRTKERANMSQFRKVKAKIERKLEKERRRQLGLAEPKAEEQLEGVIAVRLIKFPLKKNCV